MDPLTFRAAITVEVRAMTRRDAERLMCELCRIVDEYGQSSSLLEAEVVFPLPEPRVAPRAVIH